MTLPIVFVLLAAAIVLPIGVFYLGKRDAKRLKRSLAVNIVSFFSVLLFAVIFVFTSDLSASQVVAETATTTVYNGTAAGLAFLGAALSIGLGSIGAGVATGQAASAALGALSENEGIMGKAIIFVVLGEGIAIYGLIIAILILGKV